MSLESDVNPMMRTLTKAELNAFAQTFNDVIEEGNTGHIDEITWDSLMDRDFNPCGSNTPMNITLTWSGGGTKSFLGETWNTSGETKKICPTNQSINETCYTYLWSSPSYVAKAIRLNWINNAGGDELYLHAATGFRSTQLGGTSWGPMGESVKGYIKYGTATAIKGMNFKGASCGGGNNSAYTLWSSSNNISITSGTAIVIGSSLPSGSAITASGITISWST